MSNALIACSLVLLAVAVTSFTAVSTVPTTLMGSRTTTPIDSAALERARTSRGAAVTPVKLKAPSRRERRRLRRARRIAQRYLARPRQGDGVGVGGGLTIAGGVCLAVALGLVLGGDNDSFFGLGCLGPLIGLAVGLIGGALLLAGLIVTLIEATTV